MNRLISYLAYLKRKYTYQTRHRRSQALIVSYPKSGRTWLRMLLCRYLSVKYGVDNKLDLFKITNKIKTVKTTEFQHEQANHRLKLLPEDIAFDHHRYADKEVVFLHRDARDTAVSMYFQLKHRETVEKDTYFQGSLSELYRNRMYGLEKVLAFNKMWLESSSKTAAYMAVSYEQMKSDTEQILISILEFIGEEKVDLELIKETVEFSKFENMKKLEGSKDLNHTSMKAVDPSDTDHSKMRRGKVGGFKDYLSEEDLAYTQEQLSL